MAQVLGVKITTVYGDLETLGLVLGRKPKNDPQKPWTERLRWRGPAPAWNGALAQDVVSRALAGFRTVLGPSYQNAFAHRVERALSDGDSDWLAGVKHDLAEAADALGAIQLLLEDEGERRRAMLLQKIGVR